MRTWRGWTRAEDADAYAAYLMETGHPGYTSTPGNRGVTFTRRDDGDRVEFLLTSIWDSWEAVRAFAGPDPERAVFYPQDDRFLVDRELTVDHYEVFAVGQGTV
ncbi:antibiotic biosynthesis monooxygenase [Planotetraspora phitsanulokensis]|uniref:Antibiotic biosynthesis monooxygenase n=2 Tax=Planotetraspora phitsanulokensis TaxID=575192 RepID=A0A8J3XGX1_9ACTN|nr:antibiotic biosynthesis monooxygenase [Planotetraspora phitsanulokensis]